MTSIPRGLRVRLSRVFVALGVLIASQARAQNRALFSDEGATAAAARSVVSDPMVIRGRRAAVDLSLLAQPGIASGGSGVSRLAARTIDLNLFADVNLVAQLDYVETVAALGYAWVGQVSGVEGSRVVLAVADGVLSGSIELPTHLYSVTQRDGSYLIAEVNRPAQPGDDAPGGGGVFELDALENLPPDGDGRARPDQPHYALAIMRAKSASASSKLSTSPHSTASSPCCTCARNHVS